MELAGRNVLVVGMERSGIASADLLLSKGARVTATDQKPVAHLSDAARALNQRGVPFHLQQETVFERFDLIVVSPGVAADIADLRKARQAGVPVIGEVELAAPFLKGRTIGITGSNGKTTTTALTGHILAEAGIPVQVGGNIGTPVTAMVEPSRDAQWNVLELSSFQLETTITFRPDIAMVLNITQNHLDRHYTMEQYADAKGKILDHQLDTDFAVLNGEDPFCRKFATRGRARRVWFSIAGSKVAASNPDAREVYLEDDLLYSRARLVIAAKEVPIRGRHNLENTMAAIAVADLAGVPFPAIAQAVRTFHAVEHRLEFVRRLSEIDFYNDSKATSVDATLKALDAFDQGLWVILGGKDKGSDYTPLRASLSAKARVALVIGSAADKITHAIEDSVEVIQSGTLDAAVRDAFEHAKPGDTVLLAPACASFDQFQSYEHRGRVFKELVHSLTRKENGTTA